MSCLDVSGQTINASQTADKRLASFVYQLNTNDTSDCVSSAVWEAFTKCPLKAKR